ncbi:hypothetical protein D3C73_1620820 [compost metagenome]
MKGNGLPVVLRAVPFDVARILNFNQADAVRQLVHDVEIGSDQPFEPVVILDSAAD